MQGTAQIQGTELQGQTQGTAQTQGTELQGTAQTQDPVLFQDGLLLAQNYYPNYPPEKRVAVKMEYHLYNLNVNPNGKVTNKSDIYAVLAYIPESYPTSFLHRHCTLDDFDGF